MNGSKVFDRVNWEEVNRVNAMPVISPWPPDFWVVDGAGAGLTDLRSDSQAEDARDIGAVLTGDGDAYAALVRRHQAAVNRYMCHFARDDRVREELVHDVFVEAYMGLGRYRATGPFRHWLYKIATRVGYRHWRQTSARRAREVSLVDETAPETRAWGHAAERRSTTEYVRMLLEELPPRDRLVLTVLYLEELDPREAAQVLGWSHVMVRVQSYRARAKLRGLLEKAQWRETHG
jgi:RNA polymerase sigma-70 factor (ECF subfamily)